MREIELNFKSKVYPEIACPEGIEWVEGHIYRKFHN